MFEIRKIQYLCVCESISFRRKSVVNEKVFGQFCRKGLIFELFFCGVVKMSREVMWHVREVQRDVERYFRRCFK